MHLIEFIKLKYKTFIHFYLRKNHPFVFHNALKLKKKITEIKVSAN